VSTVTTTVPSTTGSARGQDHGGSSWRVAVALAGRATANTLRIPATVVPMVVMPLFFVIAFGGAFSAVVLLPSVPTDNILSWVAPFSVLQGASFAGFGSAFGAGRDLENGFFDRLLLAPIQRRALLAGALLYSAGRAVVPVCIVVPAVILAGADVPGGILGVLVLLLCAMGVAVASGLWGLGVVYRARTQRAGGFIQVGLFMAMFLSVGIAPLAAMEGTWLYWVARYNPITGILTTARSGFVGQVNWSDLRPGAIGFAVLYAVLGVFAVRGLHRLDR
jgi:ABC-type multidrug transport system permease subunit